LFQICASAAADLPSVQDGHLDGPMTAASVMAANRCGPTRETVQRVRDGAIVGGGALSTARSISS
jgi:hypothetical protein